MAADRAMQRMQAELGVVRAEREHLQAQLGEFLGENGGELARRLLASAPALACLLRGGRPSGAVRLRRNVAWHAARMPSEDEGWASWRAAQRGPRLEQDEPEKMVPAVAALLRSGPPGPPPEGPPSWARGAWGGQVWEAAVLEKYVLKEELVGAAPSLP